MALWVLRMRDAATIEGWRGLCNQGLYNQPTARTGCNITQTTRAPVVVQHDNQDSL